MPTDDTPPTRNTLLAEAWDTANARPPRWFRAPLRISRPRRGDGGFPVQEVWCSEHGDFHASGDPDTVLHQAKRHVTVVHAGQPAPEYTDPWQETR